MRLERRGVVRGIAAGDAKRLAKGARMRTGPVDRRKRVASETQASRVDEAMR